MYLKSIEIQGFKSFANKMMFEFHDGITAIVGPNGSGKSNVADAVRWVLGEQSAKQLRGAKMEDVIFSGTQTRKPLGFAYVSITLDNSDHKLPVSYEEVTAARRVYRSGESEYLLNGAGCRLKDIQELFLDTGIGKEGYSIIGQGQIDKILSGKPEDRRELFDEAAGIVKFKKRKASAEKNLEEEKQNVLRIKDILSEIEKQVAPLEKQAQTAKEYLKLRDRLKGLEVTLFLSEHERMSGQKEQTAGRISIVTDDLDDTTKRYDSTKEEYEKLQQQLDESGRRLEEAKASLGDRKIKKEQLEGRIRVLNEQVTGAVQNDGHYNERIEAVERELHSRETELEECSGKKTLLEDKLNRTETALSETEAALGGVQEELRTLDQSIDHSNSEIYEILNGNTTIKTKKQRYETMLEQNALKKTSLNQKLLKYKSDEAVFDEALNKEQEALRSISERITGLENENETIRKDVAALDSETASLKINRTKKQQDLMREKSRLDSLKNITERYEGYGQSIRRVMERKSSNPGIVGVIADIIKVAPEYETAIETALGGSIQNIVTDTEQTAKSMIEYLKQNRYGRATFLPLTAMDRNNAQTDRQNPGEAGVIGTAASLVEADSRFDGLIRHLLGRVLVVDHIDHAIAINKKHNHTLRLVTLDGELLSPGGSMSGGAYKNSGNLLSRHRELDEIKNKIKTYTGEEEELEQKLNRLKTVRIQKKEQSGQNRVTLQALYLEQNTAKLKYNQAELDKTSVMEDFHEITGECSELDAQMKELKANITELDSQLLGNERKSRDNENRIATIGQSANEKKKERDEIQVRNAALRLELSSYEQENRFLLETITRINSEMEKLDTEKHGLIENVENSGIIVERKKQEIERIRSESVQFDRDIERAGIEIIQSQQERDGLSERHKKFFQIREELSDRMIELERENTRLTGQMDKLVDQMDQQMNYMWEEYELTYQGALATPAENTEPDQNCKKDAQELKGRIKQLGEVNVNAIEDYKELSERYGLLKSQHDDLIEAETVLRGIIEELDQEMRKLFDEKFREIRERFDQVFKELFGGGKGTLELMEDEDILAAGIRIIAQPPGKKLQNMMQLSGGEKALTAIALLFAIQSLKPSPFCLLDEIEAALDDSNVGRFAKYLHKLTKDTQFIVITHRRGTMAAADTLYGITMQEKGISTLVSVNLIESELEPEPAGINQGTA